MPGRVLSSNTPSTTKIVLPDIPSYCAFDIRFNRHAKCVSAMSRKWLFGGLELSEKKRRGFDGLKCDLLASVCYPDAASPQLRVCTDFLSYLFHLDDISDEMDIEGTQDIADVVMNVLYHPNSRHSTSRVADLARDYWRRYTQTASPGTQQRHIETFDFYFQAVTKQALDRQSNEIPDIESYIALRRDSSGCKLCFTFIEYANNLDIPDEVMDHPLMRSLIEAANDLVSWANDLYSYNVEQANGDNHNMVVVVMHQQNVHLQAAIDFVGDLCMQSIDRFNDIRSHLPSWGPQIDEDVAKYAEGLSNWMMGTLHWSFASERYFGKAAQDVKASRVVTLRPRRDHSVPIVLS